jgi:meso-butanediol dehydrogenase / (S,S)-butanediol dehydrogenase / diacetyl reductase
MRLKNKVAVVTGAGSGIGKEIGMAFLKEGAVVVFSDIHESDPSVDELGDSARYLKCDVSSSSEVSDLIEKTVEIFGKIDVIVNNAGVGLLGGILDVTDDDWQRVIDINLSGTMYGMREAAKKMKEQNIEGSVINISSILGKVGFSGALAYCASKGGVVQLTRAGAVDLSESKIRVNAVAPGFIKTNMTKDVLENEDFSNMVKSSTPLGYIGEVEDIASAAVYLASDESKYVTGHILYVDGGWTAK